VRRSTLTFLGDATDAGAGKPKAEQVNLGEGQVSDQVHGCFQMTETTKMIAMKDLSVSSTTRRSQWVPLTQEEKREQRAYLRTLPAEFLDDYEAASSTVGTKVARLLEEIKQMMESDATNKCVVFSQHLKVLDCVSEELKARRVQFVRVDGSMKQHERADALLAFSSDPNIKIFLLSMRSGATGLNLMAANYCFLLDPCQNPAIEEQAIE
jgi:SNF2 family DNA or RNA helicase